MATKLSNWWPFFSVLINTWKHCKGPKEKRSQYPINTMHSRYIAVQSIILFRLWTPKKHTVSLPCRRASVSFVSNREKHGRVCNIGNALHIQHNAIITIGSCYSTVGCNKYCNRHGNAPHIMPSRVRYGMYLVWVFSRRGPCYNGSEL